MAGRERRRRVLLVGRPGRTAALPAGHWVPTLLHCSCLLVGTCCCSLPRCRRHGPACQRQRCGARLRAAPASVSTLCSFINASPQGIRAKYYKQLPKEFTDLKASELQEDAGAR